MKRSDLESKGFAGFVGLRNLPSGCASIPREPGVYAVVRTASTPPKFATQSVGGLFKGEDPSVGLEALSSKWVVDSEVIYIGRAKSLRRRIDQLARFGRGEPVAHWGGRYVWQLADVGDLLIGWALDPDPRTAEAELVAEFIDEHERLPFANLNRPRVRA